MDFKNNTRGFRNNNPGNIRLGNDWKGEKNGDDKSFETFTSIEYGIRALFKLLKTYIEKYQAKTIEDIISRYAPPSENETLSYSISVFDYMINSGEGKTMQGLFKNGLKSVVTDSQLRPLLVAAIIYHENGFQPFSIEFIKQCETL